jgi:crotonobetainyl-CoA:carnitine CoA-transferase CaiB-like acyl-CoA transferase
MSKVPDEAVETLVDELLLFRFGGHVCDGEYFLNAEAAQPHHYEQALHNARRILEQDRLAIRKQERERIKELEDELEEAWATARRYGLEAQEAEKARASERERVREALDDEAKHLRRLASKYEQPTRYELQEASRRLSKIAALDSLGAVLFGAQVIAAARAAIPEVPEETPDAY